jgi:FG-GAP repeat/IPT/TIG domain
MEFASQAATRQPPVVGGSALARGMTSALRRVALAAVAVVLAATLLEDLIAVGSSPSTTATPSQGLSILPTAARGVVSAALGAASAGYAAHVRSDGFQMQNADQGLRARFDRAGARVGSGGAWVAISARAIGYGTALHALSPRRPRASSNRVRYTRAGLSEWYVNGPLGLEQGFTIATAPFPRPTGALTLSIPLASGTRATLKPDRLGVALTYANGRSLRYSDLLAVDADGRALHGWLQLADRQLLLRVDARGARYPLKIDPLIQQGEKLTGGGETGNGLFGYSVALSGDGDTAVIGAPFDNGSTGAAWVFVRSGATWSEQGEKLTAAGEVGQGAFGHSVTVSGDGETAVIGAPFDSGNVGAAWVFTRSGATWTQGEKLTGTEELGAGLFGYSVALSGDGDTAVVGGNGDNASVGAAWVFVRSGATWSEQGEKLTGAGEVGQGAFGDSVAVSGDGVTAVVGGDGDNGGAGAAWVFVRSGATWSEQGEKLTGTEEVGAGLFGYSVALSSDASTAVIGGEADDDHVGAAWVFTHSGSHWSQQGGKLTGEPAVSKPFFGYGVALSADGDTAVIGGHDFADVGAVWVFTRTGSVWTQQGEPLSGGGEVDLGAFGSSVAVSADAGTALIGGLGDNSFVGAAWVFVNVPTPRVTGLSPSEGPQPGATRVTLTGTNFLGATAVSFGQTSATSFTVNSATSITAVSPAEPEGTVDVTVTSPLGTSAISSGDRYTFTPTVTGVSPNGGPTTGATSVTITGTGFIPGSAATGFRFGSARATSVDCTSTTSCLVRTSPRRAGVVHVRAIVSKVRSPKNPPADRFTYG